VVNVRYRRQHFARTLGITQRQLAEADRRPELASLGGAPDSYGARHLSAYRSALKRHPHRRPLSRQLFLNLKGGTGKTCLSVAYAYRLAEIGHRVLLIDLDSQAHATQHLGLPEGEVERTLYDVLIDKVPLEHAVARTALAELDVLPANLGMTTVDLSLMPMAGREYRLRRALDDLAGAYEFVVMDAPPSFGLLNLNALIAADDLFVPVLPDFLSFHGLKLLFETLGQLEEDLDHTLRRIVIVLNHYNPTTRIAREARSALRTHYPEFLSQTTVRQCTEFAQASSGGAPITALAPHCRGAKDVRSLVDEIIDAPIERGEEQSA
jgi:chromosome partitioning protein